VIITDMTKREREKFARHAEHTAEMATRLAKSLREATNDEDVLMRLIYLVLSGAFFGEMREVFEHAAHVQIPPDPAGVNRPAESKKEDS